MTCLTAACLAQVPRLMSGDFRLGRHLASRGRRSSLKYPSCAQELHQQAYTPSLVSRQAPLHCTAVTAGPCIRADVGVSAADVAASTYTGRRSALTFWLTVHHRSSSALLHHQLLCGGLLSAWVAVPTKEVAYPYSWRGRVTVRWLPIPLHYACEAFQRTAGGLYVRMASGFVQVAVRCAHEPKEAPTLISLCICQDVFVCA